MDWPDGAKYCVHVFTLDPAGMPYESAQKFSPRLRVNDSPYQDFTLRKSGAHAWWVIHRGWWWAKAHDRAFDCETQWADVGWRADSK